MEDNQLSNQSENVIEVPTPIIEKQEEVKHLTKLDIIKKISSGTGFRDALDNIVSGGMGALILAKNSRAANVFQGGFKVNCKFTPKKLTELAKMDGAIILSEDFKRILYANTLLIPDSDINSLETGTRHQAAERTAKQTRGLVIAISQRIGKITVYCGNFKYVLQDREDLLRRATETLQILEKQRDVFDELITNLNVLEVTNLVSVADVCSILQRMEMIRKMANIINEYIIELGKDGLIVRMRMKEITKGIEKIESLIIKDYLSRPSRIRQFFDNLSFEAVLETEDIAYFLFKKSLDEEIIPKGYRILSKIDLSNVDIYNLIKHFKNLNKILESDEEALSKILKENKDKFKKDLNHLREQIMVGKKI